MTRAVDPSQLEMPYTDAIRRYADEDFVRLDVPGHSGSALAQPELAELFGERTCRRWWTASTRDPRPRRCSDPPGWRRRHGVRGAPG